MIARVTWPRDRRLLAPEVIQTSEMDCGPAALKCLLEGFRVPVSYARLQEACQTDLDGTSINTVEQVATAMGLDAEQVMVPIDHVALTSSKLIPAIVVVRRNNLVHFLVVWRTHGPLVQVSDPVIGRRWISRDALVSELYVHTHQVSAESWRAWAGTREFLDPLTERLRRLRVQNSAINAWVSGACEDSSWKGLAILDAAVRMAERLTVDGGLKRGHDAAVFIDRVAVGVGDEPPPLIKAGDISAPYWSVLPDETGNLYLRGAVLLRARRPPEIPEIDVDSVPNSREETTRDRTKEARTGAIAAAVAARPQRAWTETLQLLRADGRFAPAMLVAAALAAAIGTLVEIMLFRGLLDAGQSLVLPAQRVGAMLLLLAFVTVLFALDVTMAEATLRLGRKVEGRLRAALFEKLPRINDRFFQSRLVSDMAHRAHSLDSQRTLPDLGVRTVRLSMQLVLTAVALAWFDPRHAPLALLAATLALAIPFATGARLAERELRQRSHAAALSRYYLDSLLGLTAVRTHGAERSIAFGHEARLIEWGRASLHLVRGMVAVEALQATAGLGLAVWLVLDYIGAGDRPGGTLLVVYWALSLPLIGRELAQAVRQYVANRNVFVRVQELLDAPESISVAPIQAAGDLPPADLVFSGVGVRAGGLTILKGINVAIAAGEHVAIVGRSGAGKSTLVSLLLGLHEPSSGEIAVGGRPFDPAVRAAFRDATAWVDPSIQLWNRSLFANLRYGDPDLTGADLRQILTTASLVDVLERREQGLQSSLGEGGGLVSGGEGQRIRFGRALARKCVRLAILDEPFRGLSSRQRQALLSGAREAWATATLLCVTHDIDEALTFDRVLVLEGGRIVEDGDPRSLANQPSSVFAGLRNAHYATRFEWGSASRWRQWRLHDRTVAEDTLQGDSSWSMQPGSRGR